MEITEKLIEKFFENHCSSDEAVVVADYLRKNPAVAENFLKRDWKDAGRQEKLPGSLKVEMWDTILASTGEKKISVMHKRVRWISIAASILLIAGIWRFFPQKLHVPDQRNTTVAKKTGERAKEQWIVKHNSGVDPVKYELPDGSLVTLSEGGELMYKRSFDADRRDIFLKGNALFKVFRDTTKPFTVHAGIFATTALGTVFSVSEKLNACNIRLHEGKIVIRSLQKGLKGWEKDVFLLPGQEMKYDFTGGTVALTGLETQKELSADARRPAGQQKGLEIVFRNNPLREVLKKLSTHFRQEIAFDNKEIDDMYFSGTVLKSDSLDIILRVIAQMNSLTVTKTKSGFLVKKSQ